MNDKKTEYIDNLETQLKNAVNAKHFIESTEGNYVIEYLTTLASSLTNQVLNTRRTNEEYIELRAQIDIIRKIIAVMTIQGDEKVLLQLREKIDLANTKD